MTDGTDRGPSIADRLAAMVEPADRTLPALLERQARRYGERPLAVFPEQATITFAGARDLAGRWAATLRRAGVEPGDRVALILSNRPEFLGLFLGCAFAGAVAVPINTAARGFQLQHVLSNSGAKLLVTEGAFLASLEILDRSQLAIETIWVAGEIDDDLPLPSEARPLPAPESEAMLAERRGPGDTAAIIYTSGTTGLSKGVCCPHANLFWWGANTADILALGEGERLYTALPLFHVNALNTIYQALLTGSTAIVDRRFSVSRLWTALAAHRASVTYLLGAMVPMLLSRPTGPHDRGHAVRIALGPGVPAQFHAAFQVRFGFPLVEGYGSTETNFVIGDPVGAARPGTMGRVRPGFAARVVDEADNPLAAGEAGELVLRADQPFAFASGYFGMPEKTVEAWRNLWFHTGDRVIREADGAFVFVDRLKDAIRRRGENISSYEVEQVLLAHPDIAAAAVFPVRSDLAEDEVMAALVLKAGTDADPGAILDFCRPRLAAFALPRFLDFLDALPTTENGKVQKFRLRERGVGPATFDRDAAGR